MASGPKCEPVNVSTDTTADTFQIVPSAFNFSYSDEKNHSGADSRPVTAMRQHRKNPIDIERLRRLEPVSTLSEERLRELLPLTDTEQVPLGGCLFREGDLDNQTLYLLAGDVQLRSSSGRIDRIITDRDPEARFPLDDSQPRQATAVALTRVEIMRIDNNVLDYMMTWDQLASAEPPPVPADEASAGEAAEEAPVEPETAVAARDTADAPPAGESTSASSEAAAASTSGGDRSWIRKMRHIMAFKAMPPANIKRLLERMESVEVKAGERIIEQGEPGDYYYVLTEGEAKVTRTVELATLQPGIGFGEEALISGGQRNATVTMLTDGVVMRLAKADFDALLREPMLQRLSPDEARVAVAGGARWLDVRHAREYHHAHLPKAVNIPLHELRMRLDELDRDIAWICYCGTGRRSSAAAFLLAQKGYRASVLNGGVRVMARELVSES